MQMIRTITAIALLVASSTSFAASNEKDGQGCMFTDTKGSCAMQLISPLGKKMECELHTEGTTKAGRVVKNSKTVVMKPWEVQSLEVHTADNDPFVKLDGWAKCR
jgi:hypothetical protein